MKRNMQHASKRTEAPVEVLDARRGEVIEAIRERAASTRPA